MDLSKKFKCPQCPKVLCSYPFLKRHIKTRHHKDKLKKFICDFDGKQFSTKDLIRIHMQRHGATVLTCSVCMKSYVSKHTFRKHLKSHLEKFDCKECGLSFNHKSLLINHTASKHDTAQNHKCNYCTRTFSSSASRNSHHQIAHKSKKTEELMFKCNTCQTAFETKEDLRIHSFIHFKGVIEACPFCDQIFKNNRQLNIHIHKHSTEKKFQCEECNQKFTYKSGLRKHIRLNRCKGTDIEDIKVNHEEMAELAMNQLIAISKFPNKKKQFTRVITKKQIEQVEPEKSVKKSSRPHLEYTCDECGLVVKFRKRIENHMREKHMGQNYKCNVQFCVETFKSRQKFMDHMLEAHNVKARIAKEIFSCDICDKKFDIKSIFEAHKLSHLEIRKETCNVCGASFKSVGNLRRHEKSVHASARDETCDGCNKTFKSKLSLKIHQQTVHVDTKVYVNCLYCNVIVLEKNIKAHIFNMHSEEGKVKKIECPLCQKLFKSEFMAKRHFDSVHKAVDRGITYQCNKCEYTSTRVRDLREHELKFHYEGTIYACDECGKRFKTRKSLLTHMTIHNQSVKYGCTECDAVFFTRSGLRKHFVKTHQNQERVTEELLEVVTLDA